MIDRRLHSGIFDILSFRGADCDTNHYVVVKKVRQIARKFDGERFNLRNLKEVEVRKQYLIEITNRFAALENLNDDRDINRAWENTKRISKPQLKGV